MQYVNKLLTMLQKSVDFIYKNIVSLKECKLLFSEKTRIDWSLSVQKKPKLRSYMEFKQHYKLEKYVSFNYTKQERSLTAQFRSGILPLRIETGRYRFEPLDQRICTFCNKGEIESEQHFVFSCDLYSDERIELFRRNNLDKNNNISCNDKLFILFENYTNNIVTYIKNCFLKRKSVLYDNSV